MIFTEYMLSLTLSDLTFDAHTYNGITINVFRQFESDFISILAIGDIVRLEVEVSASYMKNVYSFQDLACFSSV